MAEPFDVIPEWKKDVIVLEPGEPGKTIPPHNSDACGSCTFVANRESIYVSTEQVESVVSTGSLRKREKSILSIGRFTLPQWPGCAVWYLFQCPGCDEISRDYVHGYHARLTCQSCGFYWELRGAHFFRDAGLPEPLSFLAQIRELWEMKKRLKAEFPDGL